VKEVCLPVVQLGKDGCSYRIFTGLKGIISSQNDAAYG
jgi:hypothetical protein